MQRLGWPGRHRTRKRDQERGLKKTLGSAKQSKDLGKRKNEKRKAKGSLELVLVWKREIERSRWVRVIEGQMDN